jgi:hypothetical protein
MLDQDLVRSALRIDARMDFRGEAASASLPTTISTFFNPRGMLMHAHDRTVDHLHVAVVWLDDCAPHLCLGACRNVEMPRVAVRPASLVPGAATHCPPAASGRSVTSCVVLGLSTRMFKVVPVRRGLIPR